MEKGADIHKPNHNGGTCLINAVQKEQLCLMLLEQGAEVNFRDTARKSERRGIVKMPQICSSCLSLCLESLVPSNHAQHSFYLKYGPRKNTMVWLVYTPLHARLLPHSALDCRRALCLDFISSSWTFNLWDSLALRVIVTLSTYRNNYRNWFGAQNCDLRSCSMI